MQSKINLNIELLRMLSILGVVIIHLTTPYRNALANPHLESALFVESFVRFCIPVFFMIGGYFLIPKYRELTPYLLRLWSRIVLPLLFFSLVYLVLQKYFWGVSIDLFIALGSLLYKPVYSHLWFLYAYIGVALIVPLLAKAFSDKTLLHYFLVVWFVSVFVLPTIAHFFPPFTYHETYMRPFGMYVGYFALGYAAYVYFEQTPHLWLSRIPQSALVWGAFTIYVLFSYLTFYFQYTDAIDYHRLNFFFFGNSQLIGFVQTVSLFVFVYFVRLPSNDWVQNTLLQLTKHTYGIYFIHFIVIYYLGIYVPMDFEMLAWQIVLVYGASYLLVALYDAFVNFLKK